MISSPIAPFNLYTLRASETNKCIRHGGLVFWPALGVAPKVTYKKYARLGAP
jgi:hypothetical protein